MKAGDELGVSGEAPPAPADHGSAREGGGLRREAEKDLTEHGIIVWQGGKCCRRVSTAPSISLMMADWGTDDGGWGIPI
jgi:hypothetical protein